MAVLTLRFALSHFGFKVSWHRCLPQYENIILVTQWMRDSALIQNYNCVLQVPVHKIRPEVGATAGPPWSSIDCTVN